MRGWEARRTLRAERRRADAELIASLRPSPRLAWRVEELLSPENRIGLGRSVAEVVHASDERLLPSAAPLDRLAVRATRAELLELAARLCDLTRPLEPRGVLLTERLLVDGTGPLYGHGPADELRAAVERVRAALELSDVPAR